jgi:hypothetical protein
MLNAIGYRVGAGHDFGSRWRAGRIGKTMGKQHPLAGQFVEVRGLDTMTSVGIECFDAQVIGEDQDDVGFAALQLPA